MHIKLKRKLFSQSIKYLDRVRDGLRTRALAAALGPIRQAIYGRQARTLQLTDQATGLVDLMERYKRPTWLPVKTLGQKTGDRRTSRTLLDKTLFLYDVSSRETIWKGSDLANVWMGMMRMMLSKNTLAKTDDLRDLASGILHSMSNVIVADIASTTAQPSPEMVSHVPALSPSSLLVSYQVASNGLYGVAVDKSGTVQSFFTPVPLEHLHQSVMAFRTWLQQPSNDFPEVSAKLYQGLLGQLENLETYDRLIFWPDGPLALIPFQALRKGAAEPYLIQTHVISYVTGANAIASTTQEIPTERKLLVLANPDGTLSAAEEEARQLEEVPETQTITFLRQKATSSNLARNLSQTRWVHLAAHAHFDEAHPNFSYLQLGQGDRLYSLNLGGMSFEGRRIFLSACETGRGQYIPGDDIYGLANAFLASGAHSVIASLWRIESQSTAVLAKGFYGSEHADKDPALALAEVARDFIDQQEWIERDGQTVLLDHPYYWSAFNHLKPVTF